MLITEFLGLDPRNQTDTAQQAIRQHVKPERQIDCRILVDNDLDLFLTFLRATKQLLRSGVTHYGARSIVEHLRFHSATSGSDITFKVNNNTAAIMARIALALFDELHADDRPFFECREFLATDRGRAA